MLLGGLSCQRSEVEIPITYLGAEAKQTCFEWIAQLPTDFAYPAQSHVELDFDFTTPSNYEGDDVHFRLVFDFLSHSATDFHIWGFLQIHGVIDGGYGKTISRIEIRRNVDGLEVFFDDKGALAKEFDIEIPEAFTLSAENTADLGSWLIEFISEMNAIQGPEYEALYRSYALQGGGAALHPSAWTRMIPSLDTVDIVGWGSLENRNRLQLSVNANALSQAFKDGESPIEISGFKDFSIEAIFDRITGDTLSYDVAGTFLIHDEAESGLGADIMEMRFRFARVLAKNRTGQALPTGKDAIMNLDEEYILFMPLIRGIMELELSGLRLQKDDLEAADDFSF
ncbi:MAG: hypothetical protein COA70_00170 [Planctomycetota bacterium]|nr:MAG: hypothetical protein COA70_00170 [Planctomycetota bacterium]